MCCWFKEIVSDTAKAYIEIVIEIFASLRARLVVKLLCTLAKSAPENNLGVYVLLAASPIGYSFPLEWPQHLSGAAERLTSKFGGCPFFKVTGLTSATDSTKYAQKHKTELFTPRSSPLYSL